MTKEYLNQLTYKIIGATIEVHKSIGPGLLEKIYHRCLSHEFLLQGIKFQSEFNIPINYKGSKLSADLRCDFVVEDAIVLEIKASLTMLPVFDAQIISYMKLLKVPKGILINFQSDNIFNNGQKTFVNENFSALPDRYMLTDYELNTRTIWCILIDKMKLSRITVDTNRCELNASCESIYLN